MNEFSVLLGIVDYFNPLIYFSFLICVVRHIKGKIKKSHYIVFLIGAVMTICAGVIIPTLKIVVGLGKAEFSLPVGIVAIANIGIFLTGVSFFLTTLKRNYSKKMYGAVGAPVFNLNTFIVFFGAVGLIMTYVAMIRLAILKKHKLAILFVVVSIICTMFLCGVATVADLESPLVHWVIQLTNILAQSCLLTSAILVFKKRPED